ncbi:alpha/beta hydrolase [Flavobacteriaceae bacterium]|jgi:pimeloyl-ACP methyl ester carboxylesterase|nr:alpha/beta hydrolase [Flavobacteriaceae bacterium]
MRILIKGIKIIVLSIVLLLILISVFYGHRDISKQLLKTKYGTEASAFITIDGMDVHYRDEGNPQDSTPIVLIHGTGSSLHTFDTWTQQLISEYRVIRMDLPAYGLTGPFLNRTYTITNYVDFINVFLSKLNIKKCVLAGNSLGGNIAWNYTLKHPNSVDKLILIDASGYPSTAQSIPIAFKLAKIPLIKNLFKFITPRALAKSSIENVYYDKRKVNNELIDRYFELTLSEGNRQAFVDKLASSQIAYDYKKIKLIKQKTLILWGAQDQLIPTTHAQQFHEDLLNDTLVIMQEVGHVPMEESPFQSVKIVKDFLSK